MPEILIRNTGETMRKLKAEIQVLENEIKAKEGQITPLRDRLEVFILALDAVDCLDKVESGHLRLISLQDKLEEDK